MTFGSPQFLLLLPLLLLASRIFRSLALLRPLRALLLGLVILLLCDPRVVLKSGGIDLWVLLDRSSSARAMVDPAEAEWRTLLERNRPGENHRLHWIDYAADVDLRGSGESAAYAGNRDLTRTGLALHEALARMDPRRHNRILLFTDGYSTEPLVGVADKLVSQGVPLDYRLLRSPDETDFRVERFAMPPRVQPGEPFVVEIGIVGNAEEPSLPIEVFREGKLLFQREIAVSGGSGKFRFTDRVNQPGAHRYEVLISPANDAHTGNNRQERWIEIASGPRVLLVTRYLDDPVANVLATQGFEVATVTSPPELSPGSLSGAKAVILNNVPAYELPSDFLDALPFFVSEQGGGLLMAGGHRSFGSGGYHESRIDPLLPVSMELKSEHRKLGVAMAIVMDRSGSMAMITPSGHSKMQLANEGAARAVDLLGDMDAVTVFAVDTAPHQITPLLNVGNSRGELNARIRRIESMGGGIYVYTGLKAAWEELKKSPQGQRHIILFTDAADSEEPGEYRALIEEMRAGGTTVSVIAIGSSSDKDAAFLEDIATRGEGRLFFTDVPGDLPNIFAQETVAVARSSFVEEATGTGTTGRWYEVARADSPWPEQVDGYNLSYLREGDETALVTTDAYAAPLVAFGRRGIGRSLAVTFPLGGDFSEKVRGWTDLGDFLQTATRWLMGDELPPGLSLRHDLTGSRLSLDLYYDTGEWENRLSSAPPRVVLQRGLRNAASEELVWERLAPGHYHVSTDLPEGAPARGAVQAAGSALPFGPVTVGAGSEWQFDRERITELRETSRTSGGSEILELARAWRKPPSPEQEPIRLPLLVAILLVLLVEALATRTGWRMPRIGARWIQRSPAGIAGIAEKPPTIPAIADSKVAEKPETAVPPLAEPDAEVAKSASRRSRFERAKKRL